MQRMHHLRDSSGEIFRHWAQLSVRAGMQPWGALAHVPRRAEIILRGPSIESFRRIHYTYIVADAVTRPCSCMRIIWSIAIAQQMML